MNTLNILGVAKVTIKEEKHEMYNTLNIEVFEKGKMDFAAFRINVFAAHENYKPGDIELISKEEKL